MYGQTGGKLAFRCGKCERQFEVDVNLPCPLEKVITARKAAKCPDCRSTDVYLSKVKLPPPTERPVRPPWWADKEG